MNYTCTHQNGAEQNRDSDENLQALIQVIQDGWPEEVRECSKQTREYWNIRAKLTTVDGIIYKGIKILIPKTMRKMMLAKIHEGHLCMEKCKQITRSVMYWPCINTDIDNTMKNCGTCLQYKPSQEECLFKHIQYLMFRRRKS